MIAQQRPTIQTKGTQRFLRFLLVGLSGTLLDMGLLNLLKLLGYTTLLANTFGFSIGVVNNFTWNYAWTYADSRHKQLWLQLAQFIAVSLIGLLLSNILVLQLEAPLGALLHAPQWGYLPSKLIATSVIVFWNFLANRYWTFNDIS
jgi:putative flippase GtrA